MGNRVEGKVAIVTGAGSSGPGIGNGKATAILYAREGAHVLLVDYDLEAAEETKRIIDEEGGDCVAFRCDVSKSGDCKSMIEKCVQTFGRIDILHNNVGIMMLGGPVELTEDDWDRMMNVNLKSIFLTCKYALPYMEAQGSGSVINLSSMASIRSMRGTSVAYAASKAGIIAFTREVAIQYASKGIRVNAILPGLMNTPMVMALRASTASEKDIEEMMKRRDAACPTGKQGDAWDVAYAALFLVSDEAKYITGTTLFVDGGITALVQIERAP